MRILLISPASSIHTIRWTNALINHVDELCLASIHEPLEKLDTRIKFIKLKYPAPLGYFLNYKKLRNIIKEFKPDLINTHYLSGYGTLSALAISKIKTPYLLSMWGSDIYDFPEKSIFHKRLIKWVCKKASKLASTSIAMKTEFNSKYPDINLPIVITPFGVDTDLFSPIENRREEDAFEIGIAKVLKEKYGIEYLIKAFNIFQKEKKYSNSRLHIIGDGELEKELKALAFNNPKIKFHGRIQNSNLPEYLNKWDVYVIPSIIESFGVSAVEASSCALPVIVSNVGGLPEVIVDKVTGIVVEKCDPYAIAEGLKVLYNDKQLRLSMGQQGRKRVLEHYSWNDNVLTMLEVYNEMISKTE